MCCIQLDHHHKPSLRYGAIGLGRHTNKGHGAMAVSKFQRSAFGMLMLSTAIFCSAETMPDKSDKHG